MLEIEEEFRLDVPEKELDYITDFTPVRVLVTFYENQILKKGLSLKA